jgi:hypothetical protein
VSRGLVNEARRFVEFRRSPFMSTDAAQPQQVDDGTADARERDDRVLCRAQGARRREHELERVGQHEGRADSISSGMTER